MERQQAAEDASGERRLGTAARLFPQKDSRESQALERAPDQKVPRDSVPQAAEQKREEDRSAIAEPAIFAALGQRVEQV